ncbi:hypothetical protein [Leptolyngbya sp. FACHB-261]|uniref:hypothetical protein n=1 Tax=Leptolyngbya sp. FACHB-261 TaxID=2692806 RepID=UPI001688DD09|nr:hypothetical protein [Leptolyngbya sp. FACHB-261]MBD2103114.1 hypothetical protein [Leptolyngbya sp. FACHB-261]
MRTVVPVLACVMPLGLLAAYTLLTFRTPEAIAVPVTPEPMPSSQPAREQPLTPEAYRRYQQVVSQTVGMVRDQAAQKLAQSFGLRVLDLTWEDTGRYKNSAVGPNISDMTIQVQQRNPQTGQYELSLMPVIRHPNFSDESADVPLDRFFLLVGNEKGRSLERVSLRQFLGNPRRYLSQPNSWRGSRNSLLAERDTHALVSAQACFLPIPSGGKAQFNPVLFNYQSYSGDPAVLTILATREGTSVTVIDNQRDNFEAGRTWGQRLFFNQNGERASLTGQRESDFSTTGAGNRPTPQSPVVTAAGQEGLNMVMLIQVPLKQKQPMRTPMPMAAPMGAATAEMAPQRRRSDVEAAVIGHGAVEGPFTEIDNLEIERDPQFPVRVTVQFYKATSNGVVAEQDMREIQRQIARVYADADYVGSLVTGGETSRPTEYEGPKQEPRGWWDAFWRRHEANTGQSRLEALEMLRRLRGQNWMPNSEEELRRALEESRRQPD